MILFRMSSSSSKGKSVPATRPKSVENLEEVKLAFAVGNLHGHDNLLAALSHRSRVHSP